MDAAHGANYLVQDRPRPVADLFALDNKQGARDGHYFDQSHFFGQHRSSSTISIFEAARREPVLLSFDDVRGRFHICHAMHGMLSDVQDQSLFVHAHTA